MRSITLPCKKKGIRKPGKIPRIKDGKNGKRLCMNNGLMESKIGTWNVLSLNRAGALKNVLQEIKRYKIEILAVQETRWSGNSTFQSASYCIYSSGNCNNKHIRGVGFIVSNKINKLVMDFRPVCDSICYLRIRGKFFNYSLVCVHAPTEEKSRDEKNEFYRQLNCLYSNIPSNIMGDFNAQIGREDAFKPTIGSYSLHSVSNDIGQRVIDFSQVHELVVASTKFKYKDIHKQTWISPGGRFATQIDHILISHRHATDIYDVRSYRGAVADSDHHLVGAKIRASIATTANKAVGKKICRWETGMLKCHETKKKFKDYVSNKISTSKQLTIEQQWKDLKEVMKSADDEVLGKKKRCRNEQWWNEECQEIVNTKNEARKKLIQLNTRQNKTEYEKRRKESKRIIRKVKRIYFDEQLKKIENQRQMNDIHTFYKSDNTKKKQF